MMRGAASAVNACEMLKEKLMGKQPITKKGVAEAREWKKREKAGTVQEEIGGREVIDVRAAWTAWRWQRADCEREEGVQQARREVELVGPIGNSAESLPDRDTDFHHFLAKTCNSAAVQLTDRPGFCCTRECKMSSLASRPRIFYDPMLIFYYTPANSGMLGCLGPYRAQDRTQGSSSASFEMSI